MDGRQFDHLSRWLHAAASRRSLLQLVAALPPLSGLATLLDLDEEVAASERRRQRTRPSVGSENHRHKGRRRKHKLHRHKNKHKHGVCGDVCRRGCPFTNLQAAIDAAEPGVTIRLCAETYPGTFTIGQDVTLLGTGNGENGTILDGQGDGPVVTIPAGVEGRLEHLTITGGNTPPLDDFGGGGVSSRGVAHLTNCTVAGNQTSIHGTGIHGGGINAAELTLDHCTVRDNQAQQGFGGGIFAQLATLTDSTVSDNDAVIGGGIYILETVTLSASRMTGNVAQQVGGGIFNSGGTVTLTASSVTNNEALLVDGPYGGNGGGIFNSGGTVTLDATSTITDNEPDDCIDDFGGTGCP